MRKKNANTEPASTLNPGVTRRDFVGGALFGSGAALLGMGAPCFALGASGPRVPNNMAVPRGTGPDWTGPGGLGDYATSNGNTHVVVNSAHASAHGNYKTLPAEVIETGEVYDVVAIGGGFAGLSTG
ncbi:MAG: hypothetical protein ACK5HY_13930, partial [Parahaliea sp.]